MTARGISVGVDVGGTFTDLVAIDDAGCVEARKVLSTPSDQSEGVDNALRELGRTDVERIVHGTTVATNTLLERSGADVVLCATAGFTDLLSLRRQDRASLYDLSAEHPPPLVPAPQVVGVHERIAPEGVLLPLSPAEASRVAREVAAKSPNIVAVSLLHAYADATHERALLAALREAMPDVDIVLSSDVFPEIREYERTATTVAEAYLRPRVAHYLGRLAARLAERGLPAPGVMTSSGGMRSAAEAARNAAQLALSGPAGGVVGAAAVARAAGIDQALTIDIGGTSADVGLILGGTPLVEPGGAVAGIPISLPRVLVETVSAGGGSIGWVDDGGALRVGPRSAGAVPGPAAFGRGGTLPTVTDAHVVLGTLTATRLSGGVSLDTSRARTALESIAKRLGTSVERVAEAMIATADASMARALRRLSVERGVDPRACTLIAFGGGGPLHACGLAERIGSTRVFVPPYAGVLSALGLALTAERREAMLSVMREAHALGSREIGALVRRLAERVAAVPEWSRAALARVRYVGQGHEVDVPFEETDHGGAIASRFAVLHEARFAFRLDRPVEIVSVRVAASGMPRGVELRRRGKADWNARQPVDVGAPLDVQLDGPCSVALPDATLAVSRGWRARSLEIGGWLMEQR
jgi:N-methylhydantoinase A